MTLDEYLTGSGVTGAEFASRVGLTEASISRIRKDQQNTSRDIMRRIIAASEGLVTAEGLVLADHVGDDTTGAGAASCGNADDVSGAAVAA